MPKSRNVKGQIVQNYVENIKKSKAMYFVAPRGIKVNDINSFKMNLGNSDASYSVVKNTLFIKAVKDSAMNIETSTGVFDNGEHGVIFAYNDVVAPARIMKEFADTQAKNSFNAVAGYYEGKFIDASLVNEMANLPDYNTMIARTLATMNEVTASFVRVLQAIADKDGSATTEASAEEASVAVVETSEEVSNVEESAVVADETNSAE